MQPSLPVIDEPLSASMDGRGVNSNSSRKSSINMSALSSHEQKQSSPQLRDNSYKPNGTGPAINSKSSSRSNSNASSSHERPILNGADNLSYKMDIKDNDGTSSSPHEEIGEER